MLYVVEEPEDDSDERPIVRLSGKCLGGAHLQGRVSKDKGKSIVASIEDATCVLVEGESSGTKEESDLDPRMPEADEKMGPAEDTI